MKATVQRLGLFAALLAGCQGPEGPAGAPGDEGIDGTHGNNGTNGLHCWDLDGDGVPDANEDLNGDGAWTALDCLPEPEPAIAEETCALCHGPSRLADISVMHGITDAPFETAGPNVVDATIDLVTINGGSGAVTVYFSMTADGEPYVGLAAGNVRFSLAKLIPEANGNSSAWQNYINRRETKAAGAPGTAPDGNATPQGTTQTAHTSTFVDYGDGSYAYTFTNSARTANLDIRDVVASGVTPSGLPIDVSYVDAYTHRVAAQFATSLPISYNPSYTFRPSDGATTGITTRAIAATASCNECHSELALHGGGRKSVEYCVTCHNPGSIDANSNNTVDAKVMIHKIHMGRDLPSVASGTDYIIWGNQNSEHNYSEVGFPQPLSNCTKCHDPADPTTPDAASYQNTPTKEACGSCHDDVNFATGAGHTGGAQATNQFCSNCHPASGTPAAVADAHTRIETVLSSRFEYNLGLVNYNPATRDLTITFSVTDPTNADAPYNILTDPEFTATATGVSRLAVIVGWDTRDYHNTGSGNNAAQPISLNALTLATNNGDGSFTVTAVLPAAAAGTGVVAVEGHPAGQDPADGQYTIRVPVRSALQYFAITDAVAAPRRQAVDIAAKCDNCHGQLSVHGANRTDEGQVCVICHNPNATDIGRRPADHTTTLTADGKKEESIDFKRMIHGIHGAAKREVAYTVWGYGNVEHVFGPEEVTFPGILNNCTACHVGTAYQLPLADTVLGSTIDTAPSATIKSQASGTALQEPADDLNISPTSAVCSACHDSDLAKTHMRQNGGSFAVLQDNIE